MDADSSMNMNMDGHTALAHADHMSLMSLMTEADATHIAINDGDWSDPKTWKNGKIPGAGADVLISEGVTVKYDVVSDVELNYVRVDGTLNWATDQDTGMVVDTIIGMGSSHITIGTEETPVGSDYTAEIVFADGRINLSEDPTQISRGLVTMGSIEVSGAPQESYLTLSGSASAGSKTIKVEGDLTNWNVGDTIVVMGTSHGWMSDGEWQSQDEERVIVEIKSDGTLVLDRALDYTHKETEGYEDELEILVGNSTRNVVFSSENPDGVRGHVMIMNDDADIRFAEFDELGRTDVAVDRGTTANPNGRYPLHLHKVGLGEETEAIDLIGNAVNGGPGWGIVQHESKANVDYNFVYDVKGAGIVSETGNETGQWIGNYVASIYGDGERLDNLRDEDQGDFGHGGVAYENQSRAVIQQDNTASGSRYGWVFRAAQDFETDPDLDEVVIERDTIQFDPDPLGKEVVNEEAQIMAFIDNTVVGAEVGFDSGHRINITEETDLHSQIFDFTVWNAKYGIRLFNYTGNYVIKDSLFVNGMTAVTLPDKHEGTNIIDVTVANFRDAIFNAGWNTDGVIVGLDLDNVQNKSVEITDRKLVFLDQSDLNNVDQPILKISSGSDLTLSARDRSIEIIGTITDTAGTYDFGSNLWKDQPHQTSTSVNPVITNYDSDEYASISELLALHGTMRDDNGNWIMPVVFWISDRVTGEPYAYMVPIKLEGFSNSELEAYELTSFELPSSEIVVQDTKVTPSVTDGTSSGSQSNSGGDTGSGSNSGTDSTTGSGGQTDAGSGSGTDSGSGSGSGSGSDSGQDSGQQTDTNDTGGAVDVGDGSNSSGDEAGVVLALDGTQTFNGSRSSVLNFDHSANYELSDVEISFNFNADSVSGIKGLFSKDASAYTGGGNHVSAYISDGELLLRLQDANSEIFLNVGNIAANRDYTVKVLLGSNGSQLFLDGKLVDRSTSFVVDLSENVQDLQVGALGWSSFSGGSASSNYFDGTITDFEIRDASSDSSSGGIDVGSGSGSGDGGSTGGDNGSTSGSGDVALKISGTSTFNGTGSKVYNFDHDTDLELSDAVISFSFKTGDTTGTQGLFSKDASGYSGGGNHISAYLKNGRLVVRFQDEDSSRYFFVRDVEENVAHDVSIYAGSAGVALFYDGELFRYDPDFVINLEDNSENLQVGALGWASAAGADTYNNLFSGTITDFEIRSGGTELLSDAGTGSGGNTQSSGNSSDGQTVGTARDDTFIGTSSIDTFDGKAGSDTVFYRDADDPIIVNLNNAKQNSGDAAGDTLVSIENVTGGDGNDNLTGDGNGNILSGGAGNDRLTGNGGENALYGGHGNDVLTATVGDNHLQGGSGADKFTFIFDEDADIESRDIIYDFEQGADRINLARIDANPNRSGDQAFSFLGGSSFTGRAGEVRVSKIKNAENPTDDPTFNGHGVTMVSVDIDGNGMPDFRIELLGLHNLTREDFIL